jgi:UDP-4-amino-4-deoxy-L-arabinose-oxoglutarate aminotransferase
MDHLGTKANLPDLLACFLPDQIRTIDERLRRREEISSFYEKSLSGTKIIFPKIKEGVTHSRHLFPIYVGGEVRDQSLSLLGEAGIGVTVNYRDVPSMSYYRKKYYHKLGDFKISENWGSGTLTIPLYPDMSEAEQGHVIDFLIERIDPLIKQVD